MAVNGKKKGHIWVAMSGGVDSSVAAALLKRDGYDVTGVFMRGWEPADGCSWRAERRDARRASARLDIPLITLDFSVEYKSLVVDYLLDEYARGRTPNPDVMCNREIKFGAFARAAFASGADFIATGHYARRVGRKLLTARDQQKDQTYFLWTLPISVLMRTMFPIGAYRKAAVRTMARRFHLPMAEKKDSQGLCFVGQIDFKKFLAEHLPVKSGAVIDEDGQIIGQHRGAHFYTLGERHGFSLNIPSDQPHYVVNKNIVTNTLTVSAGQRSSIVQSVKLLNTNWIRALPRDGHWQCRWRYRQKLMPCRLELNAGQYLVTLNNKLSESVASGQSLVLYRHGECWGGGVIA